MTKHESLDDLLADARHEDDVDLTRPLSEHEVAAQDPEDPEGVWGQDEDEAFVLALDAAADEQARWETEQMIKDWWYNG